ncbi:MAG TPA: TonB-dependent receptor [Nitrospira sp.]|jgi:iron complex outermembrane receptor protein|uniref:TonB-dependent receptor family protein n=1 Tax=Nitrospira sp. ND1 TaxID=1658518 RepID=UPI0009BA9761|nr:TonB-dependent receptor [Nitrospira sp. ND1]MBP7361552.1 TonB-dependent receptor [Nitrospira sp.]MBP8200277.1 TonB-dependent receptor [Nitrospira sp.]MBP8826081.1 TonB-dependent receptor [Nitrospira sp.]MBP9634050.1 TonB-dependent receptor [Nitrospira sp.]SLM43959.1 putative TonB-dependent receptor [Nitrospira sp. ND1]
MSLFRWVIVILGLTFMQIGSGPHPARAAEVSSGGEEVVEEAVLDQREQALKQKLKGIIDQLEEVKDMRRARGRQAPEPSVIQEQQAEGPPGTVPEIALTDIRVMSQRVESRPTGVTQSSTDRSEHESQPTRHLRESLESIPGIVPRQEHGGREVNLSIRGSGNKTGCCVRNIKMYEDGFSVTQPDGTARPELHDPWFLRSIEVRRGPSSSLYDNYALGGMVHLRTRRGRDIDGVETFVTAGSYGYHKQAIAIGKEYGNLDIALFSSYQREDGWRDHSQYWMSTVNLNIRYRIDDRQTLYVKAVNVDEDEKFPTRLTLSQFRANPRQMGGTSTTNPVTLGQKLRDRLTMVGAIYERQIDANTVLTTEADYHVKDINQPVGTTVNPSFKHYTDLRHDGKLGSMPLKSYLGFFANYLEQEGVNNLNLNNGSGAFGPVTQQNRFSVRNIGGRFREELEFTPKWILAVGLGYERSDISGFVNNFSATTTTSTLTSTVGVNRSFDNWAPDISLTYRLNEGTNIWTRASVGYGIPQFSNMTVGLDGNPGFNNNVKPQKNFNVEIGTNTQLTPTLWVEAVGFWTFFKDEIITQSVPITPTTAGNFAVNAKESQYRGIELGWRWMPLEGLRLTGAYTHMDSQYIRFVDQFGTGGVVTRVNQSGRQVPSVEKNVFNIKAAYDHTPSGLGGWVEGSWIDSFYVNNNNTLGAPSYVLFNANAHHYYRTHNNRYIKFIKTYVELDNIFDKAYVAWATPVADSVADANKQAFYAGIGRAFYAGVTLGF